MPKQKTNKAVAKRFKLTGGKKLVKRTCGQGHFNTRATGNKTRKKRNDKEMSKTFTKSLKILANKF